MVRYGCRRPPAFSICAGRYASRLERNSGYPGGFPAGILLDSDGTLWVKTRTGPLLFLPRGHSRFQASKYGEGLSTGYAYLHEAPDGAIWLSDDQGLRRVASLQALQHLTPRTSRRHEKGHKRNAHFGDFTFAPDGSLWAVTGKGVQRFDHVERWPTPVAARNGSRRKLHA